MLNLLPAQESIDEVLAHLDRWCEEHPGVLVVGVDGHGASGKTTIARGVAAARGAALVHTDDFYRDPADPSTRDPTDRAHPGDRQPLPLADYYDWPALRRRALGPLRAGASARFPSRHWERPEATGQPVVVAPQRLVVLEGVTAAGPALADLVDRRVLVATPKPERLRRLHGRISDEDWDADWLLAEQAYLDSLAPSTFDLIVSGTAAPAAEEKG